MAKRKEFLIVIEDLSLCYLLISLFKYIWIRRLCGSRVYDLLFDIKNIGYVMVSFSISLLDI